MALAIVPYLPGHAGAVKRFNQRLAVGSKGPAAEDWQFPEKPDPGWMPGMQLWLAVEGHEVRGGYILRRQVFSVAGETHTVAHYRLPLSEGLVNRAYATLAIRLVRDALEREPRLYALGMGGWDRPLPQMLKRMNWRMAAVPFYFKVLHAYRFLRHIRAVRSSLPRRVAFDAAAFSGIGWLAMKLAGVTRPTAAAGPMDIAARFTGWADAVWEGCREQYGMAAWRDATTLEQLYPADNPRFLRVRTAGGWALLLDTQMHGHKQFGHMRVGTIADCLAPLGPEGTPESGAEGAPAAVIRAATRTLEDRGVDLIVSNQLHHTWCGALEEAGFRQGPTNFLIALSPALAALVGARADREWHINRGDGDGPIHL